MLSVRLSPAAKAISAAHFNFKASHLEIICNSSSSIMARSPKDGFPVFQDGDVEICLSRKPEDRFVLHSCVLGLHSPFFKVSISERWSSRNGDATPDDDAAPGDPIKWRYQLLFEEDMDDEGASLLAKAVCQLYYLSQFSRLNPNKKPEVSYVSNSSDLSPDTASIFLMQAPYVPSDDSKTKSRLALIRAHRHYLETLYHKPVEFATTKFPELVNLMVHVLRLADVYGSLAVFQIPVETVFGRVKSDLDRLCGKYYFKIVYISTLARCAWLFQYVICRLVGDPTWTDERIRKTFATLGIVPLILEKRTQLKEMMLRLDHTIMLDKVPVGGQWTEKDEHTFALATAAYKLHLLDHIEEHNRGGWKLSSEKYRVLKDQGESWPIWRYYDLRRKFGIVKVYRPDFKRLIDRFRIQVADYVSPLLKDYAHVDGTIPAPGSQKRKEHGLTCVEITDDDLPWKDIPW